ncbi:hypothetical protein JCM11641_005027 [Rhodosporidiobolus odoratus]
MSNIPEPPRKSRPSLPSLLSHLRTNSSSTTASLSLQPAIASNTRSPSSHTPSSSPQHPTATRQPSNLSLASSAPSPPSPTLSPSASPLVSFVSAVPTLTSGLYGHPGRPHDVYEAQPESSSPTSSSSSLDGLAARLSGARHGKGKALINQSDSISGTDERDVDLVKSGEEVEEISPVVAGPARSQRSRKSSYSTSTTEQLPNTRSREGAAGAHDREGHLEEEDEDDDDDDEPFELPSRFEGQPDPREILRAQLRHSTAPAAAPAAGAPTRARTPGRNVIVPGLALTQRTSAAAGVAVDALTGVGGAELLRYSRRRYFVLSTAGKLVWTSDLDEENAAGLVGVMQAIVSIFADEGDKIRYITSGSTRIAFLLKPPLYLVVVSNGWGEPESVLRSHLDHLYLQLLSIVTLAQLQALFTRRSNADLRQIISGTESFFVSLASSLQASSLALSTLTSSIEVYRVAQSIRDDCAKALELEKTVVKELDLLYVLLVAHGRLVTLLRPKKHSIHPTDLHLLLSTIYSSSSSAAPAAASPSSDLPGLSSAKRPRRAPLTEPGAESWFPICLPRFNPRGFLYAYVSFVDPPVISRIKDDHDGGIGIVVLSSRREAFEGVKEVASGVKEQLLASGAKVNIGLKRSKRQADGGLVHELEMERAAQEYSLGELAIPGLRHFFYKSRSLVQVTRPAWEGDYKEEGGDARSRLVTLYQNVHEALHPRSAAAGTPAKAAAQVQYVRTEFEAVLGWITPAFELYVCASPFLPQSAVVSAARAVSKWVQKEEQRLFLMGAPSF